MEFKLLKNQEYESSKSFENKILVNYIWDYIGFFYHFPVKRFAYTMRNLKITKQFEIGMQIQMYIFAYNLLFQNKYVGMQL